MPAEPTAIAGGRSSDPVACPCGSGDKYNACCRPLITGEVVAGSALALMRSRYSAYFLGKTDYILATWDPATRPATIGPEQAKVRWQGLEIHGYSRGTENDDRGEVEFSATYQVDGTCFTLRENSRFIRSDGSWFYLDGKCETIRKKPARNQPCPCGSGKKYKHCCNR